MEHSINMHVLLIMSTPNPTKLKYHLIRTYVVNSPVYTRVSKCFLNCFSLNCLNTSACKGLEAAIYL